MTPPPSARLADLEAVITLKDFKETKESIDPWNIAAQACAIARRLEERADGLEIELSAMRAERDHWIERAEKAEDFLRMANANTKRRGEERDAARADVEVVSNRLTKAMAMLEEARAQAEALRGAITEFLKCPNMPQLTPCKHCIDQILRPALSAGPVQAESVPQRQSVQGETSLPDTGAVAAAARPARGCDVIRLDGDTDYCRTHENRMSAGDACMYGRTPPPPQECPGVEMVVRSSPGRGEEVYEHRVRFPEDHCPACPSRSVR